MDFNKQIKSPKWQKKRLKILERDNFKCQNCTNEDEEDFKESQLHVHHYLYKKGKMYWDYEDKYLVTLCDECHNKWHNNNDFIKEQLCVLPEKQISLFCLLEYTSEMTEFEINKLLEISKIILELR